MEGMILALALLVVLSVVLTIGGLLADYIIPRCDWLNRFVDGLPLMIAEEDITDDD